MATLFSPAFASGFTPMFAASPEAGPDAGPAWLSALANRGGFSADTAFARAAADAPADLVQEEQAAIAAALAEGEARGRALAEAEFAELAEVRATLSLSMAQLDEIMQQQLAAHLAEAVAALCETALAPLVLDRAALERRCVTAAGMVGEGIIDASLRLHPDDVALLDSGFASTWHILPDVTLERGTVVFDTVEGAVIDGPSEWRLALREALGLC
ncbi:flagellar assembly protein FliH [Altererythrobacter sp. KTW20L]|uniref:flagellar assembly protein FliH n=1 Tax=Altererythrobacter sp. KTW20L TaxID=2942210 RepID=UPI0020BEF0F1|nr:flagellar assembly protein FliH [Altererythrobacter sp. KTW20L]MCL6252176.1 flagellar assembly protein FliH [Altererythrobacter sp. KTW20L]